MALQIRQFACLSDNYGFLIRDTDSQRVATIDTPDADAILAELKAAGWTLDLVLNTHWHPDHAGGNARLKEVTGCRIVGPAEVAKIAPLDQVVVDGDTVALGSTVFDVLATPGHTLGHVVYWNASEAVAFVGDTLFALGCGRLFEGQPAQMWSSLRRLAQLPAATRIFCAHEYTAANARFALSVDASAAVRTRADEVFAARERGEPTVPTTIGAEVATNPFLTAADVEEFAARRAAKDSFAG